MIKKLLQTAFICLALGVVAQQKDRLGVPGPLKFETAEAPGEFILAKSTVDPKTRVISQEYLPKSKTEERIVVTFQPSGEPAHIFEMKGEEIKSVKNGTALDIDMNTDGNNYIIRYNYKGEKKAAERREILIGLVDAKNDAAKGSYIIEYFGGNSKHSLPLEKLYESLNIQPSY